MGMDFGESLKNHLRERNLTKKDLSLKAFGHIRGLEKYKTTKCSDPSADHLKRIAKVLGVSMDKAYDYDYVETGQKVSNETMKIAELIETLDEEDFHTISEFVQLLIKKPKYCQKRESSIS
jgi:transcriptional regulator with XRE-family HTH domain